MEDWQADIDAAIDNLEDLLQDELQQNGTTEEEEEELSEANPQVIPIEQPSTDKVNGIKTVKKRKKYDPGTEPLQTLAQLNDAPNDNKDRPRYNWWTLIRAAILQSATQRMTLNEIYDAVADRYSFFKTDGDTWRNAIRHNLSVKPCFRRDKRDTDEVKMGHWTVDITINPSQGRVRQRKLKAEKKAEGKAGLAPVANLPAGMTIQDVKAARAKQAASLLFIRDPVSKLPIIDSAFAATFDRTMANMVNRSLFSLTEPVLRKALGANFTPVPPQPKPDRPSIYLLEDQQQQQIVSLNENNKRPREDDEEDQADSIMIDPILQPASTIPFRPNPELLHNFASRINILINAPISALIPLPQSSIPKSNPADPNDSTSEAIKQLILINSTISHLYTQAQPTYTRPKQSFPEMVKQILLESSAKKLTAAEIFDHIETRHPYFKQIPDSWKNTVRNVLTVHLCFSKKPRDSDQPGRGDFWVCDPEVPIWSKKITPGMKKHADKATSATAESGTTQSQTQSDVIPVVSPTSTSEPIPVIDPALSNV